MITVGRLALRIGLTVVLVLAGIVVMSIPSIIKTRRMPTPIFNPFAPLVDSGGVPADTLPLDSARVVAALDRVEDPELKFSIVELGLVRTVSVDTTGDVDILMTLTMPECPFAGFIGEQALAAVKTIPGVAHIRLKLDPSIPWDPTRLTGEAKKRYEGVFGSDPGDNR